MAHENNAVVNTEPREQVAKPRTTTLRDGLREQVAVVNQAEKENITNTITVDETKKIVEDAIKGDNEQELKDYCVVHTFEVGTKLTQKIFDSIKSGDIIKVGGRNFLAKKSLAVITGYELSGASQERIDIANLLWSKNNSLVSPSIVGIIPLRLYEHIISASVDNTNYELRLISTNGRTMLIDTSPAISLLSLAIDGLSIMFFEYADYQSQKLTIFYRDFNDMTERLSVEITETDVITHLVREL